jgi:Protein of unknown function (DUF3421)
MRTITISAALSAGLMASQAMADQWTRSLDQWTRTDAGGISSSILRLEAVAGGRYLTAADLVFHSVNPGGFICRATKNGILHPGRLMLEGPWANYCEIVAAGIPYPIYTYDVLTPAWAHTSLAPGKTATIPPNATYQGAHGQDNHGSGQAPLYFCHAMVAGSTRPGMIAAGDKGCSVPGTATPVPDYDIMVDPDLHRLPVHRVQVVTSIVPAPAGTLGSIWNASDALVGGWESDQKTKLYLCQASYSSAVVPGTTSTSFDPPGCHIQWAGTEKNVRDFEVLLPLWKSPDIAKYSFPVGNMAGAALYSCHGPDPANSVFDYGPGESEKGAKTCSAVYTDVNKYPPDPPKMVSLKGYSVLSE